LQLALAETLSSESTHRNRYRYRGGYWVRGRCRR